MFKNSPSYDDLAYLRIDQFLNARLSITSSKHASPCPFRKLATEKSIDYEKRSMNIKPERVSLSASVATEKGIGYQAFRSNFRLPRRASVPYRSSCTYRTGCVTCTFDFPSTEPGGTIRCQTQLTRKKRQRSSRYLAKRRCSGFSRGSATITPEPRFQ